LKTCQFYSMISKTEKPYQFYSETSKTERPRQFYLTSQKHKNLSVLFCEIKKLCQFYSMSTAAKENMSVLLSKHRN